MALHIGRAFERGIRRALTPTGIVLMVLTFGYTAVFSGATNTVVLGLLPADLPGRAPVGLVFPLSVPVAGALAVVSLLFGMVVLIGMTRAFTHEGGGTAPLTLGLFTRRLGRALVSSVGANVVVSVAVTIGFVLLLVPGLFLAVSFTFVLYVIGVEDARALDALRRSWALARGNRWRLFVIVVVFGVTTGVLGSLGSLLSVADPVAGQLLSFALASVAAIAGYGAVADAYLQARETTDA